MPTAGVKPSFEPARTIPRIVLKEEQLPQGREISRIIAESGALVVTGMVAPPLVAALKQALEAALAEDEARYGPKYVFRGMVHALMTRGRPFLDLLASSPLRALVQSVLGHGCILHAYNSSSMPPFGTNYSREIHVDCPRLIPGYPTNLGLTIALDAFTPDNGAMEIAPSLRERFERPDEALFEANKIAVSDLSSGDALLFNARCWHRGGVNRTPRWRHAVTLNVVRAYMRQQFDYPRMISESVARGLTEEQRAFLGFHVRMPVSMEEFLLPPETRPYRPAQE